jgi:hypothetical protein
MLLGAVNYATMMHVANLEADVAAARVRWHGSRSRCSVSWAAAPVLINSCVLSKFCC